MSFWPAGIWDPAALLRLKDFSPEAQNLLRGGGGLGPAHTHSWLGSASEQEPQIWKKPLLTGRGQSLRINGSGRDFLQRWCHGPAWVGTSSQSPVNRGGHLQAGHSLWLATGCPCHLGTLQSPQPRWGGHEQGSQALHGEWSEPREPREPRFLVPLRYKPRQAGLFKGSLRQSSLEPEDGRGDAVTHGVVHSGRGLVLRAGTRQERRHTQSCSPSSMSLQSSLALDAKEIWWGTAGWVLSGPHVALG